MTDCGYDYDRLTSTAVPYSYPPYDDLDRYVSTSQRSSGSHTNNACAVHSSVIVRGHTGDSTDTESRWPLSSCCKGATEPPAVRRYGAEDGVGEEYVMVNGGLAVYTSVIVATPGGAH